LPLAEVRPPLLLLPLMALNGAVEVPMYPLLLRGSLVGLVPWLGLLYPIRGSSSTSGRLTVLSKLAFLSQVNV
jgi:hypothetical protein